MSWRAVAAHELRVELRGRETLAPILVTGLLVVLVGALALHDADEDGHAFAGVLWMGLAFAASVGMARAFGAERDRGTLDALLTLPVSRPALYLGKATAQAIVLLAAALVVAGAHVVATGAAPASWGALALVLALGVVGLAATGTLLSAIAAQTRGREALLPVVLLPLAAPLLVATTHATADAIAGAPFSSWRAELLVLAGYDLAFAAASALLFEQAVGA